MATALPKVRSIHRVCPPAGEGDRLWWLADWYSGFWWCVEGDRGGNILEHWIPLRPFSAQSGGTHDGDDLREI